MTNNEKLVDFYRRILATVRYVGTDNGVIVRNEIGEDKRTPVIVSNKSLVLPTKEQLDHPDWTNRVAFHPMREDFSSGQSPVFEKYRNEMNYTLNTHTSFIFMSIAAMATMDKDFQKNLSREAAEYLRAVKDGDAKFKAVLTGIIEADPAKHRNEMSMIRISVQKSRKVAGQVRKRVATVSFPILEKLLTHSKENKVNEIAGVPLRGVDRDMLIALYRTIFPKCLVQGSYDTYSDSLQAPSMDALLRCCAELISCINTTAAPLIGVLPAMEEMIIPYNWISDVSNMEELVNVWNSVPMLEGNVSTGHVVKNAAAIAALEIPPANSLTPEQIRKQAQDSVNADTSRSVSVNTVPVDPGMQQMNQHVQPQQTHIRLGMPASQQPPSSGIKIDGPRDQPAISHPGQPQAYTTTAMTPQMITAASTPLAPDVQAAAGLPGMPAGQPQLINTVMGPVYMYPDGSTYTQAQLVSMIAQAQLNQAKDQQKKVQDLAATPGMKEMLAINPWALASMMPGQQVGMPGIAAMQPVQDGRNPGTPYVPIGKVAPVVQPGGYPVQQPMPFNATPYPGGAVYGGAPSGGAVYGGVPQAGVQFAQMPQGMPQGMPFVPGMPGMPMMAPNGVPMMGGMPMVGPNGVPFMPGMPMVGPNGVPFMPGMPMPGTPYTGTGLS